MSTDAPLPPVNPDVTNAIDQWNKDENQMNDFKQQMIADMATLKDFLQSIETIAKTDGPGVALMMLMSKGFMLIDAVKNDDFSQFSAKLNIATDYQTMGTLAEKYVNEGASQDGISLSDTYSLAILLQQMDLAGVDSGLDADTGKLIASAASSLMTDLFDFKDAPDVNSALKQTQAMIDDYWNANNQTSESPFVKSVDNAFDQISTATNSSSQMLQTDASVSSNSYKSYLDVETQNFTNWSNLVSDINKKSSQSG